MITFAMNLAGALFAKVGASLVMLVSVLCLVFGLLSFVLTSTLTSSLQDAGRYRTTLAYEGGK